MNATPSPLAPRTYAADPMDSGLEADLQGLDRPDAPDAPDAPDDTERCAWADEAQAAPTLVLAGKRPAGLAAEISDEQLARWIDDIADHDERALVALYDATLSRVYGLVLRVVRRPALAEEVVEDAYFQVWRQAVRFDPARGRALAWLLGMARSRAIDAVRREARFQHDSLDADAAPDLPDNTPPSDELLDAARGHADLYQALLQLNAQPRQLVALAFFRGLSHEEIADQTALPLGTVKSQIRRALITLRQVLGDGGLRTLAS